MKINCYQKMNHITHSFCNMWFYWSFKQTWQTPCSYLFRLSQSFWQGGLGFCFLWNLIFIRKFGFRNKFTPTIAPTNIQSKIKINGLHLTILPLAKDFVTVFHFQCFYAFLWLRYLHFLLMSIRVLKATDRRPWN